ncbi:HDIG domain-containing metalloprotein [Paraclostridium sordellii]|uniref:HD superfamily hydrolase n=1 Tax=Paraclostridium sordellii TaxID=1505 RepID=A0A0C7LD35_PARSO|nr:HDIG domain-containing metalloprotein [Paeniclostridium sordellii]QYE97013.1 HDIG domain-containing protein [Paeniclostridium sordellii]CEN22316.1 HD superfamily hydrolase [[Clostridium] sordellii] [Paeniclostridium sordellii]CEN79016.1 HD superfamily hydrolase [[Clostridium] sordellii] [Paeniclostridium sordellii]CEP39889.1 HD superfamily hydrolase [[Clostridium] sordellii] [Paeniclostridium sordellii]CEP96171.1 HD superfamily hydrolase [[Clostridium] sordellii] [Paeniclostridium sordellii
MENNLTFNEISKHLVNDKNPSEYIKRLLSKDKLNTDLENKLFNLSLIEQNKKYHPEGNVLNHVFMVVDEAAQIKDFSSDKLAFMWAALLHDIGKLTTTRVRKGRITSYNHDIEGEKISKQIMDKLTDNEDLKYKISKLVKFHMQPLFFDKNLPFLDCESMIKEINYNDVLLLSKADRLGRGNITIEIRQKELENIKKFEAYLKTREGK